MFLSEMVNANNGAFQDLSQDNSVEKPRDLRKTRLTLAHLNRLRMANDVRKFEFETKMKDIQGQYGASAEPAAGPGGI